MRPTRSLTGTLWSQCRSILQLSDDVAPEHLPLALAGQILTNDVGENTIGIVQEAYDVYKTEHPALHAAFRVLVDVLHLVGDADDLDEGEHTTVLQHAVWFLGFDI